MKKTIVKYANRKLYDREAAGYVNVSDLVRRPMGSFIVINHDTEEDITVDTLLQALSSDNVEVGIKLKVLEHCTTELKLQENRG